MKTSNTNTWLISTRPSNPWPVPSALLLTTALLIGGTLSACGGGGGGGGGIGGGGGSSSATDVTITNVQFKPIVAQVYEGQIGDFISFQLAPGTNEVTADATGNFASLNGRTLYTIVEDPDHILNGQYGASVVLPLQPTGNKLVLDFTQVNPQPGRYVGPLKISVCLDPQCQTKLGGTPVSIPYDITVLAGLKTSLNNPTALAAAPNTEVRVPFTVSLPAGVTSWKAQIINADQQVGLETVPGSPTSLVLVGKASAAGTYYSNVSIDADATKPNGKFAHLIVNVGVVYTVR